MNTADVLRAFLASLFVFLSILMLIMGVDDTPPGSWRRVGNTFVAYVLLFVAALILLGAVI